MKIKITLLLIIISQNIIFAQYSLPNLLYTNAADCEKAINLAINGKTTYNQTVSPKGFGNKQEITRKSNLVFEKEHNTSWYILNIERDGEIVFDIVPEDPKNDYDFIVYKYSSDFCNKFTANKLIPLRSNLSRVDKSILGITGLMANVKNNSVGKGIGNAYSKSLPVKKGEKYMLILDNVYPNGKGHMIYFNYLKEVEINGVVRDSDNKPIEADILLSDNFGNTIETKKSDKNGAYDLKTTIKENEDYNLITSSEPTFIQNVKLNTKALNDKSVFDSTNFILPLLKVGGRYNFGNINFYGNSADLLPNSYPSVEALYQLLVKDPKLTIQIRGHVNKFSNDKDNDVFNQQLSEQRALTIYVYLVNKGIAKTRLTTIGLSGSQMLFPNPKTGVEMDANKRVEIKVTSMN